MIASIVEKLTVLSDAIIFYFYFFKYQQSLALIQKGYHRMHLPIISQEPFVPHAFETLDQSDKIMIGETNYAHYIDWFNHCDDAQFERIMYWSDGLRLAGILCRPKESGTAQQNPIIIYNRGGAGESGKITVRTLHKWLYPLVKLGYVVIASQYRGNDGSEGKDELGGSDVQDVIALLPVIRSLPYVDQDNIFMLGYSRGAIDTYRALQKNVLPLKACAVISGISDVFAFERFQPNLIPLLEHYIPNYPTHKSAELTKRSVIYWVDDLQIPLLLLHGDADEMVDISTTERLAYALSQKNKPYKLIIYPGTDHSLNLYKNQAITEINTWFMHYKGPA